MNIKTTTFLVLSAVSSAAFAATPTVSNVQLSGGSKTRITYDLSGDPGIVTLEIQTNTVADLSGAWLPIDGQFLRNVSGDVSCIVQPGKGHEIGWLVMESFGRPLKNARAVLTAWATNAPPDWCVGDLSGKDVPRYYTSTNYFPYGFGHLTYKTTNIVYKLVKAKGRTFTAGEYSYVDANAGKNPHVVTLTRDYYLAIYETTQAQYHWATGQQRPYQNDDWPAGRDYERTYPVNIFWRANARGSSEQWPTDGYKVTPKDCFVGGARDKSGLFVDLPTEAEWEFAARCGGYRGVNSQIVNGEVAPYREVANVKAYDSTGTYGKLLPVGSLKANDWGFYDMVGNVAEMCLDWVFQTSNKPADITEETVDPIGLTSGGNAYVFRGSGYRADYGYNTTSRSTYGQGQIGYGFRTVVVIEPHRFASEN